MPPPVLPPRTSGPPDTLYIMGDGTTYDVFLVGYRNDLARARTLRFLDGRSEPDPAEQLPRLLYAGLDSANAHRIRLQLEQMGAQIGLMETGHAAAPIVAPVSNSSMLNVTLVRTLSMALVVLLCVGAFLLLGLGMRLQQARLSATQHATPERATPAAYATPDQAALQQRGAELAQPQASRLNADAIALAHADQFEQAVRQLRQALSLAPSDPVLIQNLQGVLLNWGLAELSAERFETARAHLEDAAVLGDQVEVLYAIGVTHMRQGNYEAAAPRLERALELAPRDLRVMQALADVRLKQDRRADALALLQRAREAGASGPAFQTRLAQLSREVDAEWDFVERESLHFRISFADDKEMGTVHTVLGAFEDAYDTVGAKFDFYPEERTAIVLYTQQDFHSVTQTPDWAGAAFDGRIKLPVRGLTPDDENLARVARHEYAHSIVGELSKGHCPVWLNEGLAVWAEESTEGERRAWADEKIAGQQLYTLRQLSGTFTGLPAAAAEIAYAQSYLAVQLLIDRYGVRPIPDLLRALSQRDMSSAFETVYRDDLASFEDRLRRELQG